MNIKTEITKLHYDRNAKGFLFIVLKFFSLFYAVGCNFKNFLYDYNVIKPKKSDAYVISVGNLTTGGVGKTPVVAEIAKYFVSKGKKACIISRGYGGCLSNKQINVISDGNKVFYNAKMAGDEPYWHAINTSAIVITSKNRFLASQYAVKNFGADVIILDDGFQHRKLHRDLDIVLMDSEKEFGNKCLLPAGPLRENISSLRRANVLVIVSKNLNHSHAEKLVQKLSLSNNIKTLLCKTEPDYVYNIKSKTILQEGLSVIAMSAIGQPEQFFEFLSGYDIKEKVVFEDHHAYSIEDIPSKDVPIITTEKDSVKLQAFDCDNIYALKLKTNINVEDLLRVEDE